MLSRIAVIDIGTNSTLMLIAEADSSDSVKTVSQYAETTRLGHQLGQTGLIGQTGIQNNLKALRKYQSLAEQHQADTIITIGTQVFRQAGNAIEIIESIQADTGLKVHVLTQKDEALFSFQGAVSGRNFSECVVMDIGGGSTELTLGRSEIQDWISLPVGAVVLTEKFLKNDPPQPEEIKKLQSFVSKQISGSWYSYLSQKIPLLCVGGTITTLAAIKLHLASYNALRVDGLELTLSDIDRLLEQFVMHPLESRKKLIPFDHKRADIIIAGTLILRTVLMSMPLKTVLVSDRGLRHGIAIKELLNSFD